MAFIGMGLSHVYRPGGVALGVVGAARSVYNGVFGKGREAAFPAGTRLRLTLAPANPVAP